MSFLAAFNIQGNGSFANETIEFANESDIGAVLSSNNLSIENINGNLSLSDLNLNDYTVTQITKFKWNLSDGYEYYTQDIVHKFNEAGNFLIELTVWSDQFNHNGNLFQFKYTVTREVEVNSRFYKFLTDNFPIWENVKNEYYDTLMKTAGSFFDKMHSDITKIYSLIDINAMNPNYFDVMAQTLGHKPEYYNKIGYQLSSNDISNFNIIDKIKTNLATDSEINLFRQFLLFSSELFREKGTPENLTKFLNFFSIIAQPVDLWTKNWGQDVIGSITDEFTNTTLSEGKLGFSWNNIKVLGLNHEYGHLIKNNASVVIDSYHKTQKLEFSAGIFTDAEIISSNNPTWIPLCLLKYVDGVYKDKDTNGYLKYTPIGEWLTPKEITNLKEELYKPSTLIKNMKCVEPFQYNDALNQYNCSGSRIIYDTFNTISIDTYNASGSCYQINNELVKTIKKLPTSLIKDIRDQSGNIIPSLEENYDINNYLTQNVTILPPHGNTATFTLKSYLPYDFIEFKPDFLLEGDVISVLYDIAETNNTSSAIISNNYTCQNFDLLSTFKFSSVDNILSLTNYKKPDNEVFTILRGIKNKDDVYADVQEYYKLVINGDQSTLSLMKVTNRDTQKVYQKINLTNDKNNYVFEKLLLNTDGSNFDIQENSIYELKVSFINDLLSVFIRKNDYITSLENDMNNGNGSDLLGKQIPDIEWTPLLVNFSVNVTQENISSVNDNDEEVPSIVYTPILTAGYFGLGSSNSIIEVKSCTVNILDYDNTLYDTIQKQVNLKPKFLDWLHQKQLNLNSNPSNIPYFSEEVTSSFNQLSYPLSESQASSIQKTYFNDIKVTEKVASRYTVNFNNQWLYNNFTDINGNLDPTFFSKIIIPYGNQKNPFFVDQPIFSYNISDNGNTSSYYNYKGTDVTGANIISSVSSNVIDNIKYAGLFFANNSIPLNSYSTMPFDSFSGSNDITGGCVRNVNISGHNFSNIINLNQKIQQYKLSGKPLDINCVYEEITPLSNYFPEINGEMTLSSQKPFKNIFFNPVIVKTEQYQRVLGVHFKNCKDIKTTINRFATEINKEVYIYGSYTIHIPKDAVKYAPQSDFTDSNLIRGYVKFNTFVPLGILNPDIRSYTLSKNFIKQDQIGGMAIELNGIFIKVSPNNFTVNNDNTITILKQNPYENYYDSLECRYFIGTDLELHGSLSPVSNVQISSQDNGESSFLLSSDISNLLSNLQDKTKYTIDDYKWWLPNTTNVWRKRDFETLTVDTVNDFVSNINYNSDTACVSAIERVFYGNQIGGCLDNTTKNIKSLQVKLTDGGIHNDIRVTANNTYYAEIRVQVNYSGISTDGINLLSKSDRLALAILNYKGKNHFNLAPVKTCVTLYVPFTWYDSVTTNEKNIRLLSDGSESPNYAVLEMANFIKGSCSNKTPTFTFAPYGLMTYLLDTIENTSSIDLLKDVDHFDMSEWNEYFINNMVIENIYEQVPQNVYNIVQTNEDSIVVDQSITKNHRLFHKFGLLNNVNINPGAYINVTYNKSDFNWKVLDNSLFFFEGSAQQFFDVPPAIYNMTDWITSIENITLNNVVVPNTLYTVYPNHITFNNTDLVTLLTGSKFNIQYYYNIYFNPASNKENYEFVTYKNNFNTEQDINFIPYEAAENDLFKLVNRIPTKNLIYSSNDPLYDIVSVDGKACLKSLPKTTISTVFGKAGTQINTNINAIKFNTSPFADVQKLYVIDEQLSIFDLSTDVYFDSYLDNIPGYKGKKCEFILKGETNYNPNTGKQNITSYYFVGIGTYDFDISLGLANFDPKTNTFKKTFLASFGDYNTKNIKSNTWYKLRVIITTDFIRVIFNEKTENERLVLNYAIANNRPQQAPLTGEMEQDIYNVAGLSNLGITYLNEVGNKTGDKFVAANVDTDLALNIRPSGFINGINLYNEYTYITNVQYNIEKPVDRIFGDCTDTVDNSNIFVEISKAYGKINKVNFVDKTLNGTLIIVADNVLYYKKTNIVKYKENVVGVNVFNDLVCIQINNNGIFDTIIVPETFNKISSLYIKDNNFNVDNIYQYLKFTNRTIGSIFTSNNKIFIEFCDITCKPWGQFTWGQCGSRWGVANC